MSAVLKEEYLPHYRYEDYKLWEGDWELIGGIAYAMAPAPMIPHQEINFKMGLALTDALRACSLCKVLPEVDWKIAEDTVVRPDTLVVCHLRSRGAYLAQRPELVVEVLSPSTKRKDRTSKYRLYESEKVPYYIMIDPAGMFAEVYRHDGKVYRLDGEFKTETYRFAIEGCEIDLSFEAVFDIE